MRSWLISLLLLLAVSLGMAQERLATESGIIGLNASTPLEDIEAENTRVRAALLPQTGELAVLLNIRDFSFPRKLMQEHFNENYMESATYPRATLTGTLGEALELEDGATETFTLSGALEIHGVTRNVEIPLLIGRQGDIYRLSCDFIVVSEDHDIEVPRLLFKKIAQEVQVAVALVLEPVR